MVTGKFKRFLGKVSIKAGGEEIELSSLRVEDIQ